MAKTKTQLKAKISARENQSEHAEADFEMMSV